MVAKHVLGSHQNHGLQACQLLSSNHSEQELCRGARSTEGKMHAQQADK